MPLCKHLVQQKHICVSKVQQNPPHSPTTTKPPNTPSLVLLHPLCTKYIQNLSRGTHTHKPSPSPAPKRHLQPPPITPHAHLHPRPRLPPFHISHPATNDSKTCVRSRALFVVGTFATSMPNPNERDLHTLVHTKRITRPEVYAG